MEIDIELVELALREDLGDGDHTSLACIEEGQGGKAEIVAKEKGILCGIPVAQAVFRKLSPQIQITPLISDGQPVKPGQQVLLLDGPVHPILAGERLALNFMQRLSGVATRAQAYADTLQGLKTQVIDTRKTTPGMRQLEKYAVRCGGGANHRMGLHDMILIKDNHIDYAGGIAQALDRTATYLKKAGKQLKVEIETRSLDDVKQVMAHGGTDRILLDNFSTRQTREAVEIIGGRFESESSGGIHLQTVRSYAECGVDYISVGDMTHHISSLDLSLRAL